MTATGRTTAIGTAIGAAGTFGLGALVARRLLFPTPYTATATVRSSSSTEVEFAATRDTRLPGTYRITRGSTSVRVGAVLGESDGDGDGDTVRRQLLDGPAPEAGDWTWDALMHDVVAEVLPGPATGPDTTVSRTHVVHVHGQSLGPRQVLRGIPVWDPSRHRRRSSTPPTCRSAPSTPALRTASSTGSVPPAPAAPSASSCRVGRPVPWRARSPRHAHPSTVWSASRHCSTSGPPSAVP